MIHPCEPVRCAATSYSYGLDAVSALRHVSTLTIAALLILSGKAASRLLTGIGWSSGENTLMPARMATSKSIGLSWRASWGATLKILKQSTTAMVSAMIIGLRILNCAHRTTALEVLVTVQPVPVNNPVVAV